MIEWCDLRDNTDAHEPARVRVSCGLFLDPQRNLRLSGGLIGRELFVTKAFEMLP